MLRLPRILLALLALVALAAAVIPYWGDGRGTWTEVRGRNGLPELALRVIAVGPAHWLNQVFVGRVLLSFLPPGPLGSHRPRDLAATLAASYVIGVIAWLLLRVVMRDPSAAYTAFVAIGGVLLFVRCITLPGAMVPRHQPAEEPDTSAARLLPMKKSENKDNRAVKYGSDQLPRKHESVISCKPRTRRASQYLTNN